MSKIELNLGPSGHNSTVVIDGVDISSNVRRIEVVADVEEMTSIVIHYVCRGSVAVFGSPNLVVHVCPMTTPETESEEPE